MPTLNYGHLYVPAGIAQVVCLGIGKLEYFSSKVQMAFLLVLLERLPNSTGLSGALDEADVVDAFQTLSLSARIIPPVVASKVSNAMFICDESRLKFYDSDPKKVSLSSNSTSIHETLIYDPLSSPEDILLFSSYNLSFIPPVYPSPHKTLYILIHAPHGLLDDVLTQNGDRLDQIVVLGNCLWGYEGLGFGGIDYARSVCEQRVFECVDYGRNVFSGTFWHEFGAVQNTG